MEALAKPICRSYFVAGFEQCLFLLTGPRFSLALENGAHGAILLIFFSFPLPIPEQYKTPATPGSHLRQRGTHPVSHLSSYWKTWLTQPYHPLDPPRIQHEVCMRSAMTKLSLVGLSVTGRADNISHLGTLKSDLMGLPVAGGCLSHLIREGLLFAGNHSASEVQAKVMDPSYICLGSA